MSVDVPEFSDLDQTQVDSARALLLARLTAFRPQVDFGRGVLGDVLLTPAAVCLAGVRGLVASFQNAASLAQILSDPAGADDDAVDLLVSNYKVTRRPAAAATGTVVVVVDRLAQTSVAQNVAWQGGGRSFLPDAAYTARVSADDVVTDSDRLLSAVGDGTYVFTINVTDGTAGAAGNLAAGAALTPDAPPANFVRAYAAATFSGGQDAETNADLLARLSSSLAARGVANRLSLEGLIRAQDDFAGLLAFSAVGYGDPEQRRYHGLAALFPVAAGGRADVYVRFSELPLQESLAVTATLVGVQDGAGVWQFGLGRDAAPGFWDVLKVVQSGQDPLAVTGYAVSSDVRNFDLTDDGSGFSPDVENAVEAVYSKYQSAVIQFQDTDTATGGLTVGSSQRAYVALVRRLPLVKDVQDYLNASTVRPHAADLLVKAPVPCDVTCHFTVRGGSGVDVSAVQEAVARAVNLLGFRADLPASLVSDAARTALPSEAAVDSVALTGRVRAPNGVLTHLASSDRLVLPDAPEAQVTYRTTVFVLDPSDVTVTLA